MISQERLEAVPLNLHMGLCRSWLLVGTAECVGTLLSTSWCSPATGAGLSQTPAQAREGLLSSGSKDDPCEVAARLGLVPWLQTSFGVV